MSATLDALPPNAAQVVLAVAVLGPDAHRRRVVALSGTDAIAVDAAIDAGVLVDDGTVLAFSHPIYAHTVYDRAPTNTRQDLHREAAAILREPRAVAHHLVAGDAVTDRDALDAVRAAGNDALGTGRMGRGGALLRSRARPSRNSRRSRRSSTAGPG